MLIGQEPKSDLEPVKQEADRHDLTMKQPANIGMFYGLKDSRISADNTDLLSLLGTKCQRDKELEPKTFKPLKYK
ncbi:hypothetical protein RGL55_004522 [Vibrio parahaemolyticus]|nr:hypothetical protein [Vibrio vulnificus]ELA8128077.1 hypothetical protein [Vibrio parahaemolyticus]ELA8147314.1 hypothetical protein [Vibrio parahaemolyticus]ELA8182323.1 hypothetical protein [Vibrio parahaemolyticus]ELB2732807.1 hypothetical protein [Vibrio parahaemolyticus]